MHGPMNLKKPSRLLT